MTHITLKEMLEEIVDCILNNKEYLNYYWRDGEGNYKKINEVDLFYKIKMEDGDFTEFDWEIEKSNLYKDILEKGEKEDDSN